MKIALFHPAVKLTLLEFPIEVRKELGKTILDLQHGAKLTLPLSKPMSSVASGVEELRIKDAAGIYRVFIFHEVSKRHHCLSCVREKSTKDAP